jgi:hypothetical protein
MEHPKIWNHAPKTFVILGCKRGGTSFLTQVLGENGVTIEHCGNGHNEDLDFVKLNEFFLAGAGGNWNDLPPDEDIARVTGQFEDAIMSLVERKSTGQEAWGWKDPRQGATIKYFLPHLKDDVYLVCVFRKPALVAESINRLWDRPIESGRKIVMDYYRRILDAVEVFINE